MSADVLVLLEKRCKLHTIKTGCLILGLIFHHITVSYFPIVVDLSNNTIILVSFLKMNYYTERFETHTQNHREY